MSNPRLPPETIDYTIDFLHDDPKTLERCCPVSKSWVPRTRKHLFASITFHTIENLELWEETFPDPSTSPAGYAKTLFIDCPQAVTTGSWIRGFSRVEHLGVRTHVLNLGFNKSATPIFPFHGFSPVIKSLCVYIPGHPPSQIFNLILSFPLLEDLAVIIHYGMSTDNEVDEMPTAVQPPTPSTPTGSLELSLQRGMKIITRRLLSLQNGIHFRRLTLT